MAFAITVGPANNTGVSLTLNGCTAGNSLIIGVWFYDASVTVTSISITAESNAALDGAISRDASQFDSSFQFASLQNITASGNKTITATLSGSPTFGGGVFAMEVSGGNIAGLFDQVAADVGVTGVGGDFSVAVSATNNNAMIVSFSENDAGNPTEGSGYTLFDLPNTGNFVAGEYDTDVGASGSKTVDYDAPTGGAHYHIIAATYNIASTPTTTAGRGSASR